MDSKEKNIDKIHKKELGFDLPEDYFLKSKNQILSKVSTNKETKIIALLKHKMVWFAAAGIALIFAIAVYKQQAIPSIKNMPVLVLDTLNTDKNLNMANYSFFEEDVLIASLFVSDNNVEIFVSNAFIEDVVTDEYLDEFIVEELMNEDLF
ncbi:hypothetical protein EC396_00295 [Lutibacter sp. HS1-25]|uniref:hypothetical protein n=1 Tax=Lutibacter sp. HS1-25 TaxID=2485000 RepID=UPI001011B1B9|nr:hypothetical protein [Lutibacter sp. HS1-25]RXP64450.1 hypothetical protein EC396_00295 [Lutibacter sp. HS1-25]